MSQPPPQVSPDGKFYWDGERWQLMPGQSPQAPPAEQKLHVVTHAAGWRYWFWGLLVGFILLMIIIASCNGHH